MFSKTLLGAQKVNTIFKILLRHSFPLLLSFSPKCRAGEGSRDHLMGDITVTLHVHFWDSSTRTLTDPLPRETTRTVEYCFKN